MPSYVAQDTQAAAYQDGRNCPALACATGRAVQGCTHPVPAKSPPPPPVAPLSLPPGPHTCPLWPPSTRSPLHSLLPPALAFPHLPAPPQNEKAALQWAAWEKQQKEIAKLEELALRLAGGAQSGRASQVR